MKSVDGRKLDWTFYSFQRMRAESSVTQMPLLRLAEGGPGDFDFTIVRVDSEYYAPRHAHPWAQVRLMLEGEQNYGEGKALPPGSVSYFPEGVYYGPHDVKGPMENLLLQFGGPSGMGYPSHEALLKASEEMRKSGSFVKGGVYETVGPDGQVKRIDGYRATWEHLMGKPLVYPKPQYYEPVVMFPEQFPWKPVEGMPGNDVKPLGSFSAGEVELKMVRAEAGAEFVHGSGRRRELLFVTEGELVAGAASLGPRSAVYTSEGEHARYTVTEDMTALVIVLPSFTA